MVEQQEMPAPPVPMHVDLAGYGFMPLYGHRLFGSDFNARCTDAEWRAGVTLWWRAWNQVPAASLPDDDVALCRLAELGRDLKTWRRLRENALRGFVLCSDGRLYHQVLSRLALEAWDRRVKDRERKARWRERTNLSGDGDGDGDKGRDGDGDGDGDVRAEAKRSEAKRGEATLEGEAAAAAAAAPDAREARLAAAAASGVYLDFRGEDLREAWDRELEGLAPERIQALLDAERLPDGGRIRLPSGFAQARRAAEQQAAAKRKRSAPQRDELADRIRRFQRAGGLLADIRRAGGEPLLEQADAGIRGAHARLVDPQIRHDPSLVDIEAVAQWWAKRRAEGAS